MAPRCPLCGACEHAIVFTIGYGAIWDALEAEWGAPISPSTREASATDERTTLLRCGSCGLEWFDPASPGGPAFYAELMGAMPYNADRWEFGVARAEIRPDDDVLDLGCRGCVPPIARKPLGSHRGRRSQRSRRRCASLDRDRGPCRRLRGPQRSRGGLVRCRLSVSPARARSGSARRRSGSRAPPQAGGADDRLRSQSRAIVEERARTA